ncbi:MAG: N-acetylmuramoyl-L-alanine amidase [Alphaproteobacteria bacterium]|nr:N-acetylmuramoyl-L-alanine amidase [Alphaproteobacteria bacterium]
MATLLLALAPLPSPATAQPAASPAVVGAISLSEAGVVTRVAIELSRRVEYELFLLDEPDRAVVSFATARWGPSRRTVRPAGVVSGYRSPPPDAGRARVVLDLSRPAKVRQATFVARPRGAGGMLVIEFEPIPAEAFRALVRPWAPSQSADVAATAPATGQLAAVPRGGLPARPPARPAALPMILLDPGHGGVDPGAISRTGVQEKVITLAAAREIRRQLEATGRYRVAMTRDGDEFLALRDRLALARAYDAALFISIHADSFRSSDVRGLSVYTLSETASDEEAAALAQRENRADLIGGVDLSREPAQVASILIDLAQRETMNRSAVFARMVVFELGRELDLLPSNPHRFAGFAVLRAPDVPSLLVELGYLSNRTEARLLTSANYRRDLARGLVRAIDRFFAAPQQRR